MGFDALTLFINTASLHTNIFFQPFPALSNDIDFPLVNKITNKTIVK